MSFTSWLVLVAFFLSTGSYLLLTLISALPARNLKKAYNAKWALVTGASSGSLPFISAASLLACWAALPTTGLLPSAGIGLALTKKLAKQGLNVVVVALNDQLLHNSFEELQLQHPSMLFRKVPFLAVFSCCCLSKEICSCLM